MKIFSFFNGYTFKKFNVFNYKIFFNNSIELLCIANMNGYFIKLNKTFIKSLGYDESYLYSKKFFDFIHSDDIQSTLDSMEHLKKYKYITCINRYRKKDDTYIRLKWYAWRINNILYCFTKDITNDYNNELELIQYKVLLEKTEDLSLTGSWRWNINTNELYWTKGLYKIYDIEDNITFDKYMDKNHPDDKQYIKDTITECISKKNDYILLHRLLINNEIKYLYSKGKYTILNNEDYIIGVSQDITQQKLIEINLINARMDAEKASEMKTRFVTNISHEIRTPLNGIIGMTNLISNTELNDEQNGYLDIIKYSSGMLLSIINNVLDFSKIESGETLIDYSNVNIYDFLDKMIASFSKISEDKKLTLTLYINPNLQKFISIDIVKVKQILNNLINNAIKFTEFGNISIIVKKENDNLKFVIKDTGIGISEINQQKLFKPFIQADSSTTRNFGGTGLGLSICKSLVNILSGTISIKSYEDIGTTITFIIPFKENNEENNKDEENLYENINFTENINSGKLIIIVEDNRINQIVIKKTLEKLNFQNYKVYNNGKLFLENLPKLQNIGIILMDLHMPEMDGYVCTKEIRKLNYKMPIIAFTANAMTGEEQKCLDIGMNDFILKPVQINVLKDIIDKWIN